MWLHLKHYLKQLGLYSAAFELHSLSLEDLCSLSLEGSPFLPWEDQQCLSFEAHQLDLQSLLFQQWLSFEHQQSHSLEDRYSEAHQSLSLEDQMSHSLEDRYSEAHQSLSLEDQMSHSLEDRYSEAHQSLSLEDQMSHSLEDRYSEAHQSLSLEDQMSHSLEDQYSEAHQSLSLEDSVLSILRDPQNNHMVHSANLEPHSFLPLLYSASLPATAAQGQVGRQELGPHAAWLEAVLPYI